MYAQDVIQKQDILATSRDETGEIRANMGDSTSGEGEVLGASLWCADGFFGVPNPPSAAGACQGLYHVEGNQQRCIATKDNRFVAAYFDLEPGDRCIVTDGPACFFIKKAQASVAMMTKNTSDADQQMVLSLDGSIGQGTWLVDGADGPAIVTIKSGEIILGVEGVSLVIKRDGIYLNAPYVGINAGKGNLGVLGTVPPAPGAMSIIYGTTGVSGVPSANWTVAP